MGYGLGGGALVMSMMRVPQVKDCVTLVMPIVSGHGDASVADGEGAVGYASGGGGVVDVLGEGAVGR